MSLFDLFRRHLLENFLLRDGRVGISPDSGKDVPSVCPHEVRGREAAADFVVPPDPGLGARMSFHGSAKIPFECTDIVALDAKSGCIHDADEFFRFGVSGTGCRKQLCQRSSILPSVHEIPGGFDFSRYRSGSAKNRNKNKMLHLGFLLVAFACAPAHGNDLPQPLQPTDFIEFDAGQAELGQFLFFDPILSGNRNISCATCHSPDHAGTDALSLGIGEGGIGVGPDRTPGTGDSRIRKRIPRNAPALWNLGAKEVATLFHDGRIAVSDIYDNGFNTPAQEWLPEGLNSVLAVQALFPLTSQFEMAGDPGENQVAGAAYDRIDAVWPILARRVRTIPEYEKLFTAAFDDVNGPLDINITHIADAIAAFMGTEFRSHDSPFDAYLAGNAAALTPSQRSGLELFYGKAGCSECHSGPLLTDQGFHALMLPHFGPGRTRQWDPVVRDTGHMGVSDRLEDAYRFRTPSLRNVALTGPYGHNGAYPTLEGIIRHHLAPEVSFARWQPQLANLPEVPWLSATDFLPLDDAYERARLSSRLDIDAVSLSDEEIADLIAFMHALSGTSSLKGRLGRPDYVPSGLEVD